MIAILIAVVLKEILTVVQAMTPIMVNVYLVTMSVMEPLTVQTD